MCACNSMQLCPNLWLLRLSPKCWNLMESMAQPTAVHGAWCHSSVYPSARAAVEAICHSRPLNKSATSESPGPGQKREALSGHHDTMMPLYEPSFKGTSCWRGHDSFTHKELIDIICISAAFWNESNEHHSANLSLRRRLAQQRNVRVKVGVAQVAHSKHQVAGQRYRVTSSLATAPHASQLRKPGNRKIKISGQLTWKSLQKL